MTDTSNSSFASLTPRELLDVAIKRASSEQEVWYNDVFSRYGDLIRVPIIDVYFIDRPSVVHEILAKRHDVFVRGEAYKRTFARNIGAGLITNDGEPWRFSRKLLHQEFRSSAVLKDSALFSWIVERYFRQASSSKEDATRIDVTDATYRIHLEMIGFFLFDTDVASIVDELHSYIEAVSLETYRRGMPPLLFLPSWIPTRSGARAKQAKRKLYEVMNELVHSELDLPDTDSRPRSDNQVVGKLCAAARDAERGKAWLDGELVTLLWAGHETTAHASAWMIYHVSQDETVQERLFEEARALGAAHLQSMAGYEGLSYHRQVISEVLRLSPAVPRIGRITNKETEIQGLPFVQNAKVAISPWVLHRHPEYWPEPFRFDPERFSPEGERSIVPGSYLPFALGPHRCIGQELALLQMTIVLFHTVSKYRLSLCNEQEIRALDYATLCPSEHIQVQFTPRT